MHVLQDQRPMLEQFLADVGLHDVRKPLDLRVTLEGFDSWLRTQDVNQDDVAYLAAQLGAYLSLYLEDFHGAEQVVVDERILIRVPVTAGVCREFDAYKLAYGCALRKPCEFRKLVEAVVPA